LQCPHCKAENVVFQALDPLEYIPTIDAWKFSSPASTDIEAREFFCLECEERVKIDFRHRYIKKIDSVPIWDERVEKIIANCKLHKDDSIPANVFDFLKKQNFKRVCRNTPCDKLIGILLEQKP